MHTVLVVKGAFDLGENVAYISCTPDCMHLTESSISFCMDDSLLLQDTEDVGGLAQLC